MTRMRSSIERIFSKFPRHAVIAVVVIAGGMILIFGGDLKWILVSPEERIM